MKPKLIFPQFRTTPFLNLLILNVDHMSFSLFFPKRQKQLNEQY